MSGIIAPFQMEKNKIVEFKITQNHNNSEFESVNVNFGADYTISEISVEDDKYRARLDLFINMSGVGDQEEQVFDIQLDMMGLFNGESNSMDREKFTEMLKINGVSTLMQLARAYVTSVTALSGFSRPIYFPMVNIFELNKLKEEIKAK